MEDTPQNPENNSSEITPTPNTPSPPVQDIQKDASKEVLNMPTPSTGIKLELIIAFLSLFISISTFVISAFQANIMQKQQKASVWAYLESNIGISGAGFYLEVHNKGVGASIVKDVTYLLNGKKFKNFDELAKSAVQDTSFSYKYYTTNPINKKVFAPAEKIRVFSISEMKYASKMVRNKIDVEIIYTNIYGDERVFRSF